MNVSAVEAASAASFQPLNAHTRAGARRPSGRYSHRRGCIRPTVHDEHMPAQRYALAARAADAPAQDGDPRPADGDLPAQNGVTVALLRAGSVLDGVFACTRKDRLM